MKLVLLAVYSLVIARRLDHFQQSDDAIVSETPANTDRIPMNLTPPDVFESMPSPVLAKSLEVGSGGSLAFEFVRRKLFKGSPATYDLLIVGRDGRTTPRPVQVGHVKAGKTRFSTSFEDMNQHEVTTFKVSRIMSSTTTRAFVMQPYTFNSLCVTKSKRVSFDKMCELDERLGFSRVHTYYTFEALKEVDMKSEAASALQDAAKAAAWPLLTGNVVKATNKAVKKGIKSSLSGFGTNGNLRPELFSVYYGLCTNIKPCNAERLAMVAKPRFAGFKLKGCEFYMPNRSAPVANMSRLSSRGGMLGYGTLESFSVTVSEGVDVLMLFQLTHFVSVMNSEEEASAATQK